MYHEKKILPNIKHVKSPYIIKRSCGFKFGSVTFTEEYQKKEEEKYINIFFLLQFCSLATKYCIKYLQETNT